MHSVSLCLTLVEHLHAGAHQCTDLASSIPQPAVLCPGGSASSTGVLMEVQGAG